jgi:hypothetical protein
VIGSVGHGAGHGLVFSGLHCTREENRCSGVAGLRSIVDSVYSGRVPHLQFSEQNVSLRLCLCLEYLVRESISTRGAGRDTCTDRGCK